MSDDRQTNYKSEIVQGVTTDKQITQQAKGCKFFIWNFPFHMKHHVSSVTICSWWVHPLFLVGSYYSIFSFMCMICRSLFVFYFSSFFVWPLCYLLFFDIRILITPLVSSNSSYVCANKILWIKMFSIQICKMQLSSKYHKQGFQVCENVMVAFMNCHRWPNIYSYLSTRTSLWLFTSRSLSVETRWVSNGVHDAFILVSSCVPYTYLWLVLVHVFV